MRSSKFFIPEIYALGIEITDTSITISAVKSGEVNEVKDVSVQLAAGIVADGRVQDRPALAKVIRKLVRTIRTSTRYAVVSIPETNVYTEILRLPAMPTDQIDEFLDLNPPANLPFNKNDLVLGWQDLTYEAMKSERAIYLVSASKTIITGFTEAVSEAGLVPMAVEPTSLSVGRLLSEAKERTLFIYLRSTGSIYVIVENGLVDFSLYSNVGLNKLTVGAPEEGTAIATFSKEIASEVAKVLRFQGQGVKKVKYMSELDIELTDAINVQTKLPTEKLSLTKWKFKEDERVGKILPSLGAGLRGALLSERDKEPTLLPYSARLFYHFRRTQSLFKTLSTVVGIATVSVVLFLVAGYGVLAYQKTTLNNRAKTVDITSDDKKLIEEVEQANKVVAEVDQIHRASYRWAGISKLALPISSGIRYTGYQTNTESLEIVVVGHARDVNDLQGLLTTYRSTSEFSKAEIPNQILGQKSNINFTIKLTVKQESLENS